MMMNKGRSIDLTKKVRVYRNLNNGLLSIKQGSLVVAYTDAITLKDVKFIVSEKSRLRVVADKVRSVHAYAEGMITHDDDALKDVDKVFYNPYRNQYFHYANGTGIHNTSYLKLNSQGVMLTATR